jgi:hypothetical protein
MRWIYVLLFLLALVPAIIFAAWVKRQPWDVKDKISAWDPFIKVMAISGAIIVGLASFERYLEQRQLESSKELFDRNQIREGLYVQAMQAAATIAAADDLVGEKEQGAVQAFWRLYRGELGRVEGRDVESAMVLFGRAIEAWKHTGKKPLDIGPLSLQLAHACKEEVAAAQKSAAQFRDRFKL